MDQKKQLQPSLTSFIDHANHKKILLIRSKIDDIKTIMATNHDNNKIELSSQQLDDFRNLSRTLKNLSRWNKYKLYILCSCITIIIVGLTIGVIMFVINQE